MITGTLTTASTCGISTTCTTGTSATLKEQCNCGTFAVSAHSTRAYVVEHNGHVNDLVQERIHACNCGVSAVFTQTAHVESAGSPNSDVDHLFNELQLKNHYVFLNSQDHRRLHLRHDGDVDDLDTREGACGAAQQRACQKPVREPHLEKLDGHLHSLHCGYTSLQYNRFALCVPVTVKRAVSTTLTKNKKRGTSTVRRRWNLYPLSNQAPAQEHHCSNVTMAHCR